MSRQVLMQGATRSARVLEAGGRALAYCLHSRVIALSLLPLILAIGLSLLLAVPFWESANAAMRAWLETWGLTEVLLRWLSALGAEGLRSGLAPLVLVALALPVVMALSLLLVAALMTPALTRLVAQRRFPALVKRQGGSFVGRLRAGLGATALALLLLGLSLPFWLLPPVALVAPPLIWGWLSYRVFAYDVLAEFADVEEREALLRAHRWPLWGIGIVCGYLGAAPSLIFAFGLFNLVLAPVLLPVAIWLYVLVFALGALWFAHYLLAALAQRRGAPQAEPA